MSVISLCSWCFEPDIGPYTLVCMNCDVKYASCEKCYNTKGGVNVPFSEEERALSMHLYLKDQKESLVWCRECYLLDNSRPICDSKGTVICEFYENENEIAIDGQSVQDADLAQVIQKFIFELERR